MSRRGWKRKHSLRNKGNQKRSGDLVTTLVGPGAWDLHLLWDSNRCSFLCMDLLSLAVFLNKSEGRA